MDSIITRLIEKWSCPEGFNGTIFLYGLTSSGKTYTMIGSSSDEGVALRAFRNLFDLINKERAISRFSAQL